MGQIRQIGLVILILILISCSVEKASEKKVDQEKLPERFLVVLGVAQDAGYPQIGCDKACCRAYWEGKEEKKYITCLALVDRSTNKYWLFEATPDIKEQLHSLQQWLPKTPDYFPSGIFITHAHIGHYSGLMQFGREAMGASGIPVYAMPRLENFLKNNGPWSQLVSLNNISLKKLEADSAVNISETTRVTPILVPHRDEYSETVGFKIRTNNKTILFIPDIDKWEKWGTSITDEIKKCDLAFLDGTFYKNGELAGRDMSEVPHPFVEESMNKFSGLSTTDKSKVYFIHFNHTNPLLKKKSAEKDKFREMGFNVAEEKMVIPL